MAYRVDPVIEYLGSKRRLVPVLGEIFTASGAEKALDLFTGATRVAQAPRSGRENCSGDFFRCQTRPFWQDYVVGLKSGPYLQ